MVLLLEEGDVRSPAEPARALHRSYAPHPGTGLTLTDA
jgi:hypothetical protein